MMPSRSADPTYMLLAIGIYYCSRLFGNNNYNYYFYRFLDQVEMLAMDEPLRLSKYVRPELLCVFGPATKFPADAAEGVFRKFLHLWNETNDPFRHDL